MPSTRSSASQPLIALGAMTFGGQTSEREARRMMDRFLDAGHSWIDTAHIYTGGASETIVGRFLRGPRRAQAYLATKVYPGEPGGKSAGGLRPRTLRAKFLTSLKRLKLDHVDLLYLHAPDNATPLEDTLAACRRLVEEGKVCDVGLSNYPAWQVAEAVAVCIANGWEPPVVYQGMYNALTRDVERECLPACRHFGLRFIAYNPLAGGLLTGKYRGASDAPAKGRFSSAYYRNRYWTQEYFAAVERVAPAVEKVGLSLTEASLRWLLRHSGANGLLLGASSCAQFEQNLTWCAGPALPLPVRRAFDAAWTLARPACQRYFRD